MSTNGWRVFCAIELADEVREHIHSHIASVRKMLPGAKASWSRPENIHLTLKFFGNVKQTRIDRISDAATRAVKGFSPFQIFIGSTGAFPGVSRARVLWIGVSDPSHKLRELRGCLEDECLKEGFLKEDRKFRPHLTIARLRSPDESRALAEAHLNRKVDEIIVEIRELIVFRSELGSAGSKYTALSKHPLNQ